MSGDVPSYSITRTYTAHCHVPSSHIHVSTQTVSAMMTPSLLIYTHAVLMDIWPQAWQLNQKCYAPYSESGDAQDLAYYPATVVAIVDGVWCDVEFDG